MGLPSLDLAFLIEIWCDEPTVQLERMAGGGENGAAVDDAQARIHAEAHALEHGGEVPGGAIARLSTAARLRAVLRAGRAKGRPAAAACASVPVRSQVAVAPVVLHDVHFPGGQAQEIHDRQFWLDARWTITGHGDAGSQGLPTNLSMSVRGTSRTISRIVAFNGILSFVPSASLPQSVPSSGL